MAEITTTQAFSDGDTVTATKMNNITANAAIQTEAITNRSAETTVDQANDLLLMYDASATALKKISLSNVIKAGTASNFPVTGNATVGGTLGVTGASTLSSTLGVSDTISATKASGTGLAVTNNATVGGTLAVTGAITASSTVNGTTIPTSKTLVTTDDTQTLTGKTVNLASNTLAGTLAQFNTSCSDADFASLDGSETLANKTLTSPVISGGTINNAVIGGTTAAAGSFTTLSATSPITTQAGTAASPAIVPTGDTNTGIFFPAADTIGFSGGGNELMRIDSSGRVGIGTTTPGVKLHISSGSADAQMRIESTGGASYDQSIHFKDTASDWYIGNKYSGATNSFGVGRTQAKDDLVIDSSGRVGIGMTPASLLDISKSDNTGSVTDFPALRVTNTNSTQGNGTSTYNYARIDVKSGNGTVFGDFGTRHDSLYSGAYIGTESSHPVFFQTGGTERLRIDSSGNVGIGTTSPTNNIGWTTLALNSSTNGGLLELQKNGTRTFLLFNPSGSSDTTIQAETSNNLRLGAGGTERLRITSGGNVGIGTTSPSSLFHVNGVITHSAGTIGSNANGTRTIQSGGSPSGGSNGDIYYIY